MSHPRNKRERFLIGKGKGKKRADGMTSPMDSWSEEWYTNTCRALRSTTKICSCQMCRNPRHSVYSKGKDKITLQERKSDDHYRDGMLRAFEQDS